MAKYILIITAIFVCLIAMSGAAQKKKIKKADDSFSAGEYFRANEQYTQAFGKLKDRKTKAEVAYKLGECNRHMNLPRQAEKWYAKAVSYKYTNPLTFLYYGDALKMNEKYEDAQAQYEKYQTYVPDDKRGPNGVESCKLAQGWLKTPNRYKVSLVPDINSKLSDFGPGFGGSNIDLFFTSSREGSSGTKFNNVSGQNFSDIFYARLDKKGKWSIPVPVDGINSPIDEGACSLSKDGNTIYFTRCNVIKNQSLGCQIFFSSKRGENWSTPKVIPIVKDSSLSVGHPNISPDDLTLYFVSDMKGGQGGKDIWKVERPTADADWGRAENMGIEINTRDDEMYPFIKEDGTLFFSSNGYIGMGGLDIFKAKKDNTGHWNVENMKFPVNSPADDFGVIFDGMNDRGYFSSSRAEGKGSDDIYYFERLPLIFTLKGLVKNETTNDVIPLAEVKMIGSDGTSSQTKSGEDGTFKFGLKENTDYVVTTQKESYLKGKGKETTKGLNENKNLEMVIFMTPIANPIEVTNIEYDYNKADLRVESMVSLDKLFETLEENSTIAIELGAHTDIRGTIDFNIDLSQRRAQSVVDYLINKGIAKERLTAKGYGSSQPNLVSKKVAEKYPFLKENDVLDENFINKLSTSEQKEICHQINRRTQFKVLSTQFNGPGK